MLAAAIPLIRQTRRPQPRPQHRPNRQPGTSPFYFCFWQMLPCSSSDSTSGFGPDDLRQDSPSFLGKRKGSFAFSLHFFYNSPFYHGKDQQKNPSNSFNHRQRSHGVVYGFCAYYIFP